MGPARESEFSQDVSEHPEQSGLLSIDRHTAEQAAAIPAESLQHVQAFELGDDAAGGQLQPTLTRLTL